MTSFSSLLSSVKACTICAPDLPFGPRPVLQVHPKAKILIAGQAPGMKAHESGVPFDDASGKRLREWLGISEAVFYDPRQVAILPMGFCFPGTGKSGDLPPRPECEVAWRKELLGHLSQLRMTVVLGKYAQGYHLKKGDLTVTQAVKVWEKYWPTFIPLPHPSPRNNLWLRKNPWFEVELVPRLQQQVSDVLSS